MKQLPDAASRYPSLSKFSKLSDLYGAGVESVTLHNLLHMASGARD